MTDIGLTEREIMKIQRELGTGALAQVKDNPYILSRLFKLQVVDGVAKRLGVSSAKNVNRAVAIAEYELDRALLDGHCFVHTHTLLAKARADCKLTNDQFTDEELSLHGTIVVEGKSAMLRAIYDAETYVAEQIKALAARVQTSSPLYETDADTALENDADQLAAVRLMLNAGVGVVTGAPGTGKSTSVTRVLDALDAKHLSYALCAPTGKAAKRITEITGRPATTIHRLLAWTHEGFTFNANNTLLHDVVIVDECFPYRQPVLTETGWQPIGRLVSKRVEARVWSRNPQTAQLELKPIVRWLKRPAPKELIEIDASRSASRRFARLIRCTAAHKLLTPTGYVRAETVRAGDPVIVCGIELTDVQRSVLVGSVLGDGSLRALPSRPGSPQPAFMQGVAQKPWLLFKHRIFGSLASKLAKKKSGYGTRDVWSFNLCVTDTSTRLASQMLPAESMRGSKYGRRWAPSAEFLAQVDALAVAVWFLDNGSTSKVGAYASLHTHRFTEVDNRRLAAWFTARFGITPTVHATEKRLVNGRTRKYFFLWFGKAASAALFDLIRPYTPKCMARKVPGATDFLPPPQTPTETTVAIVRAVRRVKMPKVHTAHVYDLEVADHHNYVAGNIVVSNCSMVDIKLVADLLAAIDPARTRVIFIGDANQLPPVGPGAFFNDLITSGVVPVVWLQTLHRAAAGSWIYRNAPKILVGRNVELDTDVPDFTWYETRTSEPQAIKEAAESVIRLLFDESLGWDDFQLLAPMKIKQGGAIELNRVLQKQFLKVEGARAEIGYRDDDGEPTFVSRGDRVIQTKNDYDLDVFNGETGEVALVESPSRVRVRFDGEYRIYKGAALKNLALSYALTIHKYQGSQALTVIVICHSIHGRMLNRRLFYTAVTRARKRVIVIGDERGVNQAISSTQDMSRRTQLAARIKGQL